MNLFWPDLASTSLTASLVIGMTERRLISVWVTIWFSNIVATAIVQPRLFDPFFNRKRFEVLFWVHIALGDSYGIVDIPFACANRIRVYFFVGVNVVIRCTLHRVKLGLENSYWLSITGFVIIEKGKLDLVTLWIFQEQELFLSVEAPPLD